MANDTWLADARRNTDRLSQAIAGLSAELERSEYTAFWQQVKQAQSLFRELKPTLREDRERLWGEFGSLCSRAKEQQERQRSQRANISKQKRDLVESKLNEGYYQAKGAGSGSDLRQADDLLEVAKAWMKDGYSGFNLPTQLFTLNDGVMTKADADACWSRYKEIKEIIRWRRKEFSDYNYTHFKEKAYEARGLAETEPKEAKEKVRHVQVAMKGHTLERWQFDEIRGILDEAYHTASGVQKRRHDEWERKQDEWRFRIQAARSRKLELLEKNRDALRNIENQIDRCRDMLREARSSEHEQRVQGWIDEKFEKIRDIERFNSELEDQVREIDDKLNR
jgi:vacuolar-type H+-ATPase subunit D/Vma8